MKPRFIRFLTSCAILFAITATQMTPVIDAADREHAVVSQQDTVIRRGQVVEDVLVLGGNATVAGHVTDILVVINGNVHLTPTATTGIVVDLGGTVQQDTGARVEAVYHLSLSTPFWSGALFGSTFIALLWVGMLALSIGLMLLAIMIAFGLRHQIAAPVKHIERSVRRVGLTGVLMTFAVLAMSALCAVTIVGLPVTAVILCLYLATGAIGCAVVSVWIGKLATRHWPSERSIWMLALIGSSLMMAFTNIPIIGALLFGLLWLIGVGSVTAWGSDAWKARRTSGKLSHRAKAEELGDEPGDR